MINIPVMFMKVRLRKLKGCAMAQAVSRLPLTEEARVRSRVGPCGICGGKVALGQVYLRVLRFSPVNFIPPMLHENGKAEKTSSSSSQGCTISFQGCGASVASATGPFKK
jgi:hypothetical protein